MGKTKTTKKRGIDKVDCRPTTSGLASALFSATQQRVLSLLFGQPNRSFYTSELIKLVGSGSGAVQRELKRLEDSKLITMTRIGNQKHYQANHESPIFNELAGIISKTLGINHEIHKVLSKFKHIKLAFIYGSIAKSSDKGSSDIDLLIVTDVLNPQKLIEALEQTSKSIARTINPTIYTPIEYQMRKANQSPFLMNILNGPTISIIGSSDELEAA